MGNGKGVQTYVAFGDGGECEKGAALVHESHTKHFGKKWMAACTVIPWILFVVCLVLLGLVSCWGWEQHRQLQEQIAEQNELQKANFPIDEDVNSDNVIQKIDDDGLTDEYDDDETEEIDEEIEEEEIDEEIEEEEEAEEEAQEEAEEKAEEEAEEGVEDAENEIEENEEDMEEEYEDEAVEEAEYAKEQAEEAEEEAEEEVEEEAKEAEEEAAEEDYSDVSATSESPLDEATDVISENGSNFEDDDYMISTENIIDLDDIPEIDTTEMTDDEALLTGNDDNFDDAMGIDAIPTFNADLGNDFGVLEDNMESNAEETNTVV